MADILILLIIEETDFEVDYFGLFTVDKSEYEFEAAVNGLRLPPQIARSLCNQFEGDLSLVGDEQHLAILKRMSHENGYKSILKWNRLHFRSV